MWYEYTMQNIVYILYTYYVPMKASVQPTEYSLLRNSLLLKCARTRVCAYNCKEVELRLRNENEYRFKLELPMVQTVSQTG